MTPTPREARPRLSAERLREMAVFAPCIIPLNDLHEYQDALRQAAADAEVIAGLREWLEYRQHNSVVATLVLAELNRLEAQHGAV